MIKPYLIATVAIGTSVATGDLICQYLESRKAHGDDETKVKSKSSPVPSWLDLERSRVMCTTAVMVSTPWSFTLARALERFFPG